MTEIGKIFLATLTRDIRDAGSGGNSVENRPLLNVTINVDGNDILDASLHTNFVLGRNFGLAGSGGIHERAIAGIAQFPVERFDTEVLTNSSIRLGIRGTDAWIPQHAFLIGSRGDNDASVPLAIETGLVGAVSADPHDAARLTMPIRLVRDGGAPQGEPQMVIRRVLLLIGTDGVEDAGTDESIELEIRTANSVVFTGHYNEDTSQEDLEAGSANWYERNVDDNKAFTKLDVLAGGSITLRILGRDAWIPKMVFVFGLDTKEGRPNAIVALTSDNPWRTGPMSADPNEDPLEGVRQLRIT